jgi:hypothetical protein
VTQEVRYDMASVEAPPNLTGLVKEYNVVARYRLSSWRSEARFRRLIMNWKSLRPTLLKSLISTGHARCVLAKEQVMTKTLLTVVLICLCTLPAVCQSAPKYQVGTIIAVERNRDGGNESPEATSYDVSVQVNGTVYVVRYKNPLAINTVEYAAGGEVLVLVGEKTIRYNDLLGRSWEAPIVSSKPSPPRNTK